MIAAAAAAAVPAAVVGTVTGSGDLKVAAGDLISVETLRRRHEAWLPEYMAGGT